MGIFYCKITVMCGTWSLYLKFQKFQELYRFGGLLRWFLGAVILAGQFQGSIDAVHGLFAAEWHGVKQTPHNVKHG